MGEEVKMAHYQGGGADDDERVIEWEMGLPTAHDLTPLCQSLIPPELASAFSISPEPYRTLLEVNRASRSTMSTLRGGSGKAFSSNNNFKSFVEEEDGARDPTVLEPDDEDPDRAGSGSDSRKLRKIDCAEEADSALRTENSTGTAVKRPRLVWTPQLHKRFVDVVAHLGIKNAVPKTIMQLMNVEGLTRENVASHLQKYRLYLKRMQGLSNEGPSSSDQLFASTPVPQSLHESGGGGSGHSLSHGHGVPVPMPYPPPPHMMSMPVLGMPHAHHGHMGIPLGSSSATSGYHGFDSHHHSMLQQRDWSANKFKRLTIGCNLKSLGSSSTDDPGLHINGF